MSSGIFPLHLRIKERAVYAGFNQLAALPALKNKPHLARSDDGLFVFKSSSKWDIS
jgi:hypothetical protein